MNKKTIAINLIILLVLDVVLGTVYSASRQPDPKRAMVERSERAFRVQDDVFHHGLRPGFDGQAFWEKPYRITTDNLGSKSRPGKHTDLRKSGGRTVWLGDSFTEGIGVEYDSTFVGRFEHAYPAHEMVNLGVASYSPKLYKEKLRHFLGLGLEYDNLVLCLDISDIQDELVYSGRHDLVDTRERRLYKTIQFLRDHSLIFSFLQRFARRTSLYRRIVGHEWKYSEEKPIWTDDDPVFEEWGRLGLASAAANMDTLVAEQRRLGKRMALVVYPWPWHLRAGSFQNRQTAFWQDFCQRRGLPFINLFEVYRRECRRLGTDRLLREYFIDKDVHWTPAGHAFVYRALDTSLPRVLAGADGTPAFR